MATMASSRDRGFHPRTRSAFALVALRTLSSSGPSGRMRASNRTMTRDGDEALALCPRIRHGAKRCLDMSVSKATLDRALRVMDSLLKALEARGFEIEVTEGDNPDPLPRHSPRAQAKPDRRPDRRTVVEFGIEEKTDSFETPPSRPGSYDFRPRYERPPNGRLTICLRGRS